jgi:hypothetical protein
MNAIRTPGDAIATLRAMSAMLAAVADGIGEAVSGTPEQKLEMTGMLRDAIDRCGERLPLLGTWGTQVAKKLRAQIAPPAPQVTPPAPGEARPAPKPTPTVSAGPVTPAPKPPVPPPARNANATAVATKAIAAAVKHPAPTPVAAAAIAPTKPTAPSKLATYAELVAAELGIRAADLLAAVELHGLTLRAIPRS